MSKRNGSWKIAADSCIPATNIRIETQMKATSNDSNNNNTKQKCNE